MPKFKSSTEAQISNLLSKNSFPNKYETAKFSYSVIHKYTPDFQITDNFFLEVKGRWTGADRSKHKYVRDQNPNLTILLVFQNPQRKISKVSKLTYATYCDKMNWPWCSINNLIPTLNKYNFNM